MRSGFMSKTTTLQNVQKNQMEANKNEHTHTHTLRNFDGHAQAGHEMTGTLAAMACVWMVWAWQLAHMALLDERDDEF